MKFEWDENKNELNIEKHGLDFEDAAEIFDSPMLIAVIRDRIMAKIAGSDLA